MLRQHTNLDEFEEGTGRAVTAVRTTRQAIVEAAHSLLMERGDAGVKVRSVASRVGVTTGALYGYFATREDLVSAAYRYELTLSVASFHDNVAADERQPLAVEKRAPEVAHALSPEGRQTRLAWLSATLRAQHDAQLAQTIEPEQQELLRILASRVRESQVLGHVDPKLDPMAVAAVTFGSSLGMSAMWHLFEGIEGFAEKVADVWCSNRMDEYSSWREGLDATADQSCGTLASVNEAQQVKKSKAKN
jgi:AcrR family transcriptional regulator